MTGLRALRWTTLVAVATALLGCAAAEHRRAAEGGVRPGTADLLQPPSAGAGRSTPDVRAARPATLDAVDEVAAIDAVAPPAPRWSEAFLLPVQGIGGSGFGEPGRFAVGGSAARHLGADIAAPSGTPIVATNDGIVRVAGFYPVKGGWVVLDHGHGVVSHYLHQAQILVAEGDVVARGEPIGTVGATGLATGPHLHWEMRVHGVPTDPMAWVGRHDAWLGGP